MWVAGCLGIIFRYQDTSIPSRCLFSSLKNLDETFSKRLKRIFPTEAVTKISRLSVNVLSSSRKKPLPHSRDFPYMFPKSETRG